jgi:hypothetical protein
MTISSPEARLTRSCARMGFRLVPATAGRYTIVTETGTPVVSALSLTEVEAWIRKRVKTR